MTLCFARVARILAVAAVLAMAATSGGCATVPAYKRGVHADRRMRWVQCAERASALSHVYAVREGAAGGFEGAGGGCGCD